MLNVLQCVKDMFDFICTSVSAFNSYFGLIKQRVSDRALDVFFPDLGDYELFGLDNSLSDENLT